MGLVRGADVASLVGPTKLEGGAKTWEAVSYQVLATRVQITAELFSFLDWLPQVMGQSLVFALGLAIIY